MLDKEHAIDGFFRQQYEGLPAGTSPDADWQQLQGLLASQPPRRRLRKKTVRRIISYMGGLALVTTVVWVAVRTKYQVAPTTKPVIDIQQINPLQPVQPATIPASKNMASVRSNSNSNIPPATRLVKRKKYIVRQQSDTMMLPVPVAKNINKPTPQPTTTNLLPGFMKQVAEPVIQFVINPVRDTMLICPQGTTLLVSANSFVTKDYRPINEHIQLSVKECYNYTDMVANQLSTTTDDDVLVTGGMVHIAAITDTRQVATTLKRPIYVKMPMQRYNPAMQLYLPALTSDSSNSFNWRPAAQVQTYVSNIPFKGRNSIKILDIQQKINKGKEAATTQFYVQPIGHMSEEKIKQLLRHRYPDAPSAMMVRIAAIAPAGTAMKKTGAKATQDGFVATDSLCLPFEEALRLKLLRPADSLAFVRQRRQDSVDWRVKVVKDSMAYVQQKKFENTYNFSVRNLGWINCDRLLSPGQPRVEFVLNTNLNKAPMYGRYHLVFTAQKAIVTGSYRNGQIYFGNIPVGMGAQLICVYQQDGQVMSCVQPVQVSANAAVNLRFAPTQPTLFKQQLAVMDAALTDGGE
jgi:hypothetical protein